MSKTFYKIRLRFNLWYRERQTDDVYIDVIDAKIWWLKGKSIPTTPADLLDTRGEKDA